MGIVARIPVSEILYVHRNSHVDICSYLSSSSGMMGSHRKQNTAQALDWRYLVHTRRGGGGGSEAVYGTLIVARQRIKNA